MTKEEVEVLIRLSKGRQHKDTFKYWNDGKCYFTTHNGAYRPEGTRVFHSEKLIPFHYTVEPERTLVCVVCEECTKYWPYSSSSNWKEL